MGWTNIKLIWFRELRDQLRDRRTLFTVVVLPLLLYPFMGISLIQVTQFFKEHPTKIWIVGRDHLPTTPPLILDGQLNPAFMADGQQDLLQLYISSDGEQELTDLVDQFKKVSQDGSAGELIDQFVHRQMLDRGVDLAIIVPKPIGQSLIAKTNDDRRNAVASAATPSAPGPTPNVYLFVNSASDKSRMAFQRMELLLQKWQTALTEKQLALHQLTVQNTNPIHLTQSDVAAKLERQAAAWSKTLPLLIMIWCLTGAFYPAVDLCAGEKERGTFETLLSSPASRSEIAIGKLLTVMAFSISTALLNLLSMGFTSIFVLSRLSHAGGGALAALGPPPINSLFWLILAIIPIAALFSAVSLAAAAFARSSKEGQYYLVPLIMASMPLMVLPMLPAAKLDFGSSMIPITNVMLLLRGLIEGNYREVLPYLSIVMLVTLVMVVAAVRWVVHQFNSESVLFRASERFGIGVWAVHLFKDRGELPALGHALLCGVLILLAKFFMGFAISMPSGWGEFARQTLVVLIATVAMPAILMAIILTRRPSRSLKLVWVRPSFIAAGLLIAMCLHPAFTWMSQWVLYIYPPGSGLNQMNSLMSGLLESSPSIWLLIGVFAIAPAILEELAFRGFILSGAQALKSPWLAIGISSLFFGAAHAVFQQSIMTFAIGMVLGYIAVRTGSLLPCIAYHATHNSITALSSQVSHWGPQHALNWLFEITPEGEMKYLIVPSIALFGLGSLLLVWLWQNTTRFPRSIDRAERFAPDLKLLGGNLVSVNAKS